MTSLKDMRCSPRHETRAAPGRQPARSIVAWGPTVIPIPVTSESDPFRTSLAGFEKVLRVPSARTRRPQEVDVCEPMGLSAEFGHHLTEQRNVEPRNLFTR